MSESRSIELQVVAEVAMTRVIGTLMVRCSHEVGDRLGTSRSGCESFIVSRGHVMVGARVDAVPVDVPVDSGDIMTAVVMAVVGDLSKSWRRRRNGRSRHRGRQGRSILGRHNGRTRVLLV